ncbi:unnamed protein product [Triticum turgidum subsp. durum]|uniref:Malectin-like domain-containing protein n=1 Tax=Triticum turgidum subsp. durum TaxID=4567 RepID=A0A9R1QE57_TRITD|nr:unnamed protein product [Triticum turgidum subsp. durum]
MAATARLRPARARGVLWSVSVWLVCGAAAYAPEDNYLVSCGSSLDTPVGRRLFLADDGGSGSGSGAVTLTSPRSAAVKAPPDLVSGFRDAALYQNARVFSAPSSYSFAIRRRGRHFLRLHFFPFVYRSYDLAVAARAFKVRYNRTLNRLPGQATATDAPDIVYATARELVINRSSFDGQKQMAWQFDVDAGSSYFIRFHFCDIVSEAPHQLHINAYVDDASHATVLTDLDLAAVGDGALAFPYYKDFVLPASEASGKLAVHVGPLANKIVMPAAILNGIEIMKMHLSAGSVVVVEPAAGAAKSRLAVILGSVCGALAFVSIAIALAIVLRKKKGEGEEGVKEQPTPTRSQSSTPWMPLLGRLSVRGAIASGSSSFTTAELTPPRRQRSAVDCDGLDFSDVSSLNMVTELTPPKTGSMEGDGVADDDDFTDASMRGTFWQMVNVRSR